MDKYFDQDPIIKMKNIHKSFGDKEVLKGVDFDLHKCEVHADRKSTRLNSSH